MEGRVWSCGFGDSGIWSLVKQLRHYTENGHGATDRPFIIYGQSGQATIGLYIGQSLLNQDISNSALKLFQDNMGNLTVSTSTLATQLCDKSYNSKHIFGIMATSNGMFSLIQNAITIMRIPVCSPERAFRSWDKAKKGGTENWPYDVPTGKDTCGDSTFENDTSGGSPLVEDCLQIVKNIEGDTDDD